MHRNTPGRIRTRDHNPSTGALYPLSYGGVLPRLSTKRAADFTGVADLSPIFFHSRPVFSSEEAGLLSFGTLSTPDDPVLAQRVEFQ